MLDVENIDVFYDQVQVLWNVSFNVNNGEVVTVIGANGAGKTTILNTVCGILHPGRGKILFQGMDISRLSSYKIVKVGISLSPEGRQLFGPLTVRDNLMLGSYIRDRKREKKQIGEELDSIYELFPILKKRGKQISNTLSGGEQQMLSIARAMMSRPKLLSLDEPSMGLAPLIVKEIFRVLSNLKGGGISILLIEQNTNIALDFADRAYLLETGKIVLHGASNDLRSDDKVKQAYLGKELNVAQKFGMR